MSTAQAEAVPTSSVIPPEMIEAIDAIDSINGTGSLLPEELFEESRLGFEELRRMSHVELRGVIADRVALLEGILREREERREALQTARMASKLLNLRRERSIKIRRQVDFGSTLAAVASTLLIVAVMI